MNKCRNHRINRLHASAESVATIHNHPQAVQVLISSNEEHSLRRVFVLLGPLLEFCLQILSWAASSFVYCRSPCCHKRLDFKKKSRFRVYFPYVEELSTMKR